MSCRTFLHWKENNHWEPFLNLAQSLLEVSHVPEYCLFPVPREVSLFQHVNINLICLQGGYVDLFHSNLHFQKSLKFLIDIDRLSVTKDTFLEHYLIPWEKCWDTKSIYDWSLYFFSYNLIVLWNLCKIFKSTQWLFLLWAAMLEIIQAEYVISHCTQTLAMLWAI